MTALDPDMQAWIDAQLAVAPPPPPEAVALFARTFATKPTFDLRERDMTDLDDAAVDEWIAQQLATRPPLTPEQAALVVRTFGPAPTFEVPEPRPRAPQQPVPVPPREVVPVPRKPARDAHRAPRRVALYRHVDAAGVLLYVGISVGLRERTDDHARSSEWAAWVVESRAEWFPNRDEALRAEREAIEREAPIFNVIHARAGAAERRLAYLAQREQEPQR